MKDNKLLERVKRFEQINRKMDGLYHEESTLAGVPDCTGMILYALSIADSPITQKEICEEISMPKQTVNSALKKLENEGIIEFFHKNDRRYKDIHLTEEGKAFSEKTAGVLIQTLCNAFSDLTDSEQLEFLRLYEKLALSFEDEISKQH